MSISSSVPHVSPRLAPRAALPKPGCSLLWAPGHQPRATANACWRRRAPLEPYERRRSSSTISRQTSTPRGNWTRLTVCATDCALQPPTLTQWKTPVAPPEVPVGLRSDLLKRRPDLRQAEAEIASATAHVGEAKAEWFPRFTLFGTAGRQASQLHDITLGVGNFFSAGPAISVPVFTGGRIRSNIRVQDVRLQQSVIRYRSAVPSALEENENALGK